MFPVSPTVAFVGAVVTGVLGLGIAIVAVVMGVIWLWRYKEDPAVKDIRDIRGMIEPIARDAGDTKRMVQRMMMIFRVAKRR